MLYGHRVAPAAAGGMTLSEWMCVAACIGRPEGERKREKDVRLADEPKRRDGQHVARCAYLCSRCVFMQTQRGNEFYSRMGCTIEFLKPPKSWILPCQSWNITTGAHTRAHTYARAKFLVLKLAFKYFRKILFDFPLYSYAEESSPLRHLCEKI